MWLEKKGEERGIYRVSPESIAPQKSVGERENMVEKDIKWIEI